MQQAYKYKIPVFFFFFHFSLRHNSRAFLQLGLRVPLTQSYKNMQNAYLRRNEGEYT